MESINTDKKNPILLRILNNKEIRKSIKLYLISVVVIPVICFIFGFKTLGNFGTGLLYGSLCFVLFGSFTFAGNTVPAQLSKLALPKYKTASAKRGPKAENDFPSPINKGKRFFISFLINGALLFVTGLLIKLFS